MRQYETIVPIMQVDSSYHAEFIPMRPLPPLAFKPPQESARLSPTNPAVDLVSTYLGDYVNRQTTKPDDY